MELKYGEIKKELNVPKNAQVNAKLYNERQNICWLVLSDRWSRFVGLFFLI